MELLASPTLTGKIDTLKEKFDTNCILNSTIFYPQAGPMTDPTTNIVRQRHAHWQRFRWRRPDVNKIGNLSTLILNTFIRNKLIKTKKRIRSFELTWSRTWSISLWKIFYRSFWMWLNGKRLGFFISLYRHVLQFLQNSHLKII